MFNFVEQEDLVRVALKRMLRLETDHLQRLGRVHELATKQNDPHVRMAVYCRLKRCNTIFFINCFVNLSIKNDIFRQAEWNNNTTPKHFFYSDIDGY